MTIDYINDKRIRPKTDDEKHNECGNKLNGFRLKKLTVKNIDENRDVTIPQEIKTAIYNKIKRNKNSFVCLENIEDVFEEIGVECPMLDFNVTVRIDDLQPCDLLADNIIEFVKLCILKCEQSPINSNQTANRTTPIYILFIVEFLTTYIPMRRYILHQWCAATGEHCYDFLLRCGFGTTAIVWNVRDGVFEIDKGCSQDNIFEIGIVEEDDEHYSELVGHNKNFLKRLRLAN